jgi:hypothetical protein
MRVLFSYHTKAGEYPALPDTACLSPDSWRSVGESVWLKNIFREQDIILYIKNMSENFTRSGVIVHF